MENESNCISCNYRLRCEDEYGKIGIDEETCEAIEGSHFCRKSWDDFICCDGKTIKQHHEEEQNEL